MEKLRILKDSVALKSDSSINPENEKLPKLVGNGNFPGDSFSPVKLSLSDKYERLSGNRRSQNDTGIFMHFIHLITPF